MSRLIPHYSQARAAFICVDLQGAFAKRTPNFANCAFVANRFAKLHGVLSPDAAAARTAYIVTEQYPKGLGHTVPEITIPSGAPVLSKTKFSCVSDEFLAAAGADCETFVLFGIEAHVCVLQTVADLIDLKKRVVLAVDGVGSQKLGDRKYGLKRAEDMGAVLGTSEGILLEMTRDASDPKFKEISKLLRDQLPQTF